MFNGIQNLFHGHSRKRRLTMILGLVAFSMTITWIAQAATTFNPGCEDSVGDALQLQEAVAAANANGKEDTIQLVSDCLYTLTETLTITADGNNALIIEGNGAVISGGNAVQVITVEAEASLTMNNVIVRDGSTTTSSGGGIHNDGGTVILTDSLVLTNTGTYGGIANVRGSLTLDNSTVSDNIGSTSGGIYNNGGTVTLTSSTVSANTTHNGSGGIFNDREGILTISGSTISDNTTTAAFAEGGGIFSATGTVTITDSAVQGNTSDYGGGISSRKGTTLSLKNTTISANKANVHGGGISSIGSTTLEGVTVSGNLAGELGGGIHNSGELTLTDSTISGNTAAHGGGFSNLGGVVGLIGSVVSGNTGEQYGGGIYNYNGSTLTVTRSTLYDNQAAIGGGIYNYVATATLENSTLFNNRVAAEGMGGGIFNGYDGLLTLVNSTLSDNGVDGDEGDSAGGGLHNDSGDVTLTNTIIANSFGGSDCLSKGGGDMTVSGVNLIEDGSCDLPDALTGDPMLDVYAGRPAYFPLLVDSPAIDAAANDLCLATDQLGTERPQDGNDDGTALCDLGAFERLPAEAD